MNPQTTSIRTSYQILRQNHCFLRGNGSTLLTAFYCGGENITSQFIRKEGTSLITGALFMLLYPTSILHLQNDIGLFCHGGIVGDNDNGTAIVMGKAEGDLRDVPGNGLRREQAISLQSQSAVLITLHLLRRGLLFFRKADSRMPVVRQTIPS